MQVKQGFTSFFAKFFLYLMIFQSSVAPSKVRSTSKNDEIWKKFGNKMKKSHDKIAFNLFLNDTAGTRSPGFGYLFRDYY